MTTKKTTVKDLREQLGAFLTKPLPISTGEMSTQQNYSVTSIGAGGVQGSWELGVNGRILVPDSTNDRVLIGNF